MLEITGDYNIDGDNEVSFLDGYRPDGTESFEVAIASGGLEGFFANADPGMGNTAFGVQTGFATFDVVYDTGADTVTLENVTNTVPAPGSMAVSGIGGLALLERRFRTRRG